MTSGIYTSRNEGGVFSMTRVMEPLWKFERNSRCWACTTVSLIQPCSFIDIIYSDYYLWWIDLLEVNGDIYGWGLI